MTAWIYPLKQTWKPTWRSFLLRSLLLQINRKVTPFKQTISRSKNLWGNNKLSRPTRLISSHLVTYWKSVHYADVYSLVVYFSMKTRHMSHPWHLYHADTRSASSLSSNMPLSSFPNPPTGLSGSAMGYLLHWKNAEQWGHVIWNLCIHLWIANRPSQHYNQIRSEALWKPKR